MEAKFQGKKHETLYNDNPSVLIAAQIYTSLLDVRLRISHYNLLILVALSTKFVVQGRDILFVRLNLTSL